MAVPPKEARRVRTLIARLEAAYPDAALDLRFSNPFELLVALILAAQCTDERVNQLTGQLLFAKYPTPGDVLGVDVAELEQDIRSTGCYRSKAKALRACCRQLVDEFGGRVPEALDELIRLHGVGRKTANILRGNAFGADAIGVDTHVGRLAQRLGLASARDPDKIEAELTERVPRRHWTHLCHLLQAHGRRVCLARKPRCWECPIEHWCPWDTKTPAPAPSKARPAFGRRPEGA